MMARRLDQLPWGPWLLWPWGRWRSRDEGWPIATASFPQILGDSASLCELQDGREENQPLPTSLSPLGIQVLHAMGPGRAQRVGGGRCGQRARVRDGRSGAPGRPPGSEELGWQVTGPGNWSSPGAHGLAGEGELQPFLPWDGGAVAQRAAPSQPWRRRTSLLPAHSPGQWEPWAHPSLCRISGGFCPHQHFCRGQQPVRSPRPAPPSFCVSSWQARSYTHSRSMCVAMHVCLHVCTCVCVCACACVCTHPHLHVRVCMCVRVSVCARVSPVCGHTHIYMHARVHVCARVSVYVRVSPCVHTPTFTYMSMCACVHVCLCMCVKGPCVHIYIHACVCMCASACICMCICVCI